MYVCKCKQQAGQQNVQQLNRTDLVVVYNTLEQVEIQYMLVHIWNKVSRVHVMKVELVNETNHIV